MADNPNRPAVMSSEAAEAIRGALGQAIEDAEERLVLRWAVVVETAGKDGRRELERLCDPTMASWDLRGFFWEGCQQAGWMEERGEPDG